MQHFIKRNVNLMVLLFGISVINVCAAADAIRIKDLGRMQGWRENAVVGYGIVTGLAGTGDSSTNKTTRQALANVFSQFNLTVSPDQIQSRNVAVVLVTAALPTFAHEGDTLDITVTSAGDPTLDYYQLHMRLAQSSVDYVLAKQYS
jgi:flagellar P-ring protein precursor FlgI